MQLRSLIALAATLSLASAASARADHLLISELLVSPTGTVTSDASAKFIEVYNPTTGTLDLSNYYLSDYPDYFRLPAGNFNYGDVDHFLLKFPNGTTIPGDSTLLVCQNSTTFVQELGSAFGGTTVTFSAQLKNPQLLEVKNSSPDIADMVNLKASQLRPHTLGMASAGGFVSLFYWNGQSDLVQDVDIVRWGTPAAANGFIFKTDISQDGPDPDTATSTYRPDNGAGANTNGTNPAVLKRVSADETGESTTNNGNGITGHDESAEGTKNTFASVPQTASTPGLANVSILSAVTDWQMY